MIKYYIVFVLSVFIASCSQIILKKSADKEHKSLIAEYLNPQVIIGYGMLFASTLLTIMAYSKIDYKNGPIIESAGYIFVLILSRIYLDEHITKKKIIGNIIILIGIFVFYL